MPNHPHAYAFASDNVAAICPEAFAVLLEANQGTLSSYGADRFTDEACRRIRDWFETDCEVFFVFNGTAANALALSALCQGYHAVVCHEKSHIMTDECGAPEFFTGGSKLLACPGENAKLTSDVVESAVMRRRDLHFPKPGAFSLTQATEFGTVYTLTEIQKLTETARRHGLRVHMDGARFANALTRLGCSAAEMTWKSGVEILSLGLTKLGAGIGEAVVVFDRTLAAEFDYRTKRAGQLASKMRLLTAPWCGLLRDNAWRGLAERCNQRAQQLGRRLHEAFHLEPLFPVEANAVFVKLPESVNRAMIERGWHYYELAGVSDSRLMCSWATTEEAIEAFCKDLEECMALS